MSTMEERIDCAIKEHVAEFAKILGKNPNEIQPLCGDPAGFYLVETPYCTMAFSISDIYHAVRMQGDSDSIYTWYRHRLLTQALNKLHEYEPERIRPVVNLREWLDDAPVDSFTTLLKEYKYITCQNWDDQKATE